MTRILLAARGAQEIELLQALENSHDFTVARRCVDAPELIAAATTGAGQIAVIEADFCSVDLELLTEITRTGCAIILVVPSPEFAALARMAAQMQIPVAADSREVLEAAQHLRATASDRPEMIADDAAPVSGNVAAVWGPAGAPGRTRFAIEISSHLAARGARTLLVDADPYGGAIAPTLGLLDEASGLIAATRDAGRGNLNTERLLRHAVGISGTLRTLVGIPRPDRWPELPRTGLEQVWQVARAGAHWTVIDCGFSLEADEELMFDTRAPQRNAATLSALEEADVVIAVGQADPVAIPRFVRGLSQLRDQFTPRPVVPVITRVRASVAGGGADTSIRDILQRYAGVSGAFLIAEDRDSFDAALLAGKSVLEVAPAAPATKEIAKLVAHICGRVSTIGGPPGGSEVRNSTGGPK